MRTVIVRGRAAVPDALRDVIDNGSTSVQECRVPGPTPLARDVDRVVFFTGAGDADVDAAAVQAARAEPSEWTDKLVYVTTAESAQIEGLGPNEIYVWPREEDRLKMAFMTSA